MQPPGLYLTAEQIDEHGLTRFPTGDRMGAQVYRETCWQLRRPTGKWGFAVHDLREKSIDIIRRYQSANGAYVACPNFEQYRYCWLRDGSFIAYAMDRSGVHQSARSFYKWVHGVIHSQAGRIERAIGIIKTGRIPDCREMLPTRYTLDGAVSHDEWTNFQLDGYGTWLWGLSEHARMTGSDGIITEMKASVDLTIDYLVHFWQMPNYDCWEEFGDQVHPATLACIWGGLTSINRYLERADVSRTADTICDFIFNKCTVPCGPSSSRFAKSIGNSSVDASLMWIAVPFGVAGPHHPIVQNTVAEVERKLHHGGVHRYPEDTYYGGGEWPLLACWLGWHYCRAGEPRRAEAILKWVESCANEAGEIPEQISVHANDPSYYPVWYKRWGPVATPLLWSSAMYLVLHAEICEAKSCTMEVELAKRS